MSGQEAFHKAMLHRQTRLAELESMIVTGLEHIATEAARVGAALREIRDERLYEPAFASFAAYLRSKEHWTQSRQRAYQLIDYVDVCEELSTNCRQLPSEGQARELIPLDPQERQAVWEEMTANGEQPTAAAVAEEVEKRLEDMTPQEQIAAVEESEAEIRARQAQAVRAEMIDKANRGLSRWVAVLAKLNADTSLRHLQRAIRGLPKD